MKVLNKNGRVLTLPDRLAKKLIEKGKVKEAVISQEKEVKQIKKIKDEKNINNSDSNNSKRGRKSSKS